jgi:hypothetical protein
MSKPEWALEALQAFMRPCSLMWGNYLAVAAVGEHARSEAARFIYDDFFPDTPNRWERQPEFVRLLLTCSRLEPNYDAERHSREVTMGGHYRRIFSRLDNMRPDAVLPTFVLSFKYSLSKLSVFTPDELLRFYDVVSHLPVFLEWDDVMAINAAGVDRDILVSLFDGGSQ